MTLNEAMPTVSEKRSLKSLVQISIVYVLSFMQYQLIVILVWVSNNYLFMSNTTVSYV